MTVDQSQRTATFANVSDRRHLLENQVRLPQVLIFNHIGNRESRCDAGVTQSNASGKPSELSDTHSPLIHPLPKKKHLHHVIRAWRLQLDALPLDMVLHFT